MTRRVGTTTRSTSASTPAGARSGARNEPVLAWHAVRPKGFLSHHLYDTPAVRLEPLSVTGAVKHCSNGLHACARAVDVKQWVHYAEGIILCRVRLSGRVVSSCFATQKFCAKTRQVLWAVCLTAAEVREATTEAKMQRLIRSKLK